MEAQGTTGNWQAIVFANNTWVILTNDTPSTAGTITSPDANTWTYHAGNLTSSQAVYQQLMYGGTAHRFLAVANNLSGTAHPWTSADGITWTQRNFASWPGGDSAYVGASPTLFVAVDPGTGHYETSPDGATWTAQSAYTPSGSFFGEPFWDGTKWLVGVVDGDSTFHLATSSDGIHWTEQSIPGSMTSPPWTVGGDGAGNDVLTTNNDAHGAYGSPGSWTAVDIGTGGNQVDGGLLAVGSGIIVAGSSNGTIAHSENNGATWFNDTLPGGVSAPVMFATGQGMIIACFSNTNSLINVSLPLS